MGGTYRNKNGTIENLSGGNIVDNALDKTSDHAISNAATATKFEEIDETIGDTDISDIGDGTVTGAIDALSDDLSRHNLGSRIDITMYDSGSNYYTTDSDGYAFIYNATGQTAYIAVGGNNINIGGATGRFAVFVRKDTALFVAGTPTIAAFVPLV